MDTEKRSNRIQLGCTPINKTLFIALIKRRIIETSFAILGYLATRKTSVPDTYGVLLGGIIGMIIAQLILPEKNLQAS